MIEHKSVSKLWLALPFSRSKHQDWSQPDDTLCMTYGSNGSVSLMNCLYSAHSNRYKLLPLPAELKLKTKILNLLSISCISTVYLKINSTPSLVLGFILAILFTIYISRFYFSPAKVRGEWCDETSFVFVNTSYIKNTGSFISFHLKLNEMENLCWSFVTLSFIRSSRYVSTNNLLGFSIKCQI